MSTSPSTIPHFSSVAQLCPTLCNPMDCSLPGSSVHGIFQARVLERGAIAFSKEGWAPKNWCFQIVVLEKTLESLLDSKEIKPVNLKGNQLWIFFEKTEAEAPILWPPDVKSQLIGKDPDAGKDWRQCRGPAPADPGYSKERRHRRGSGNNCLIKR